MINNDFLRKRNTFFLFLTTFLGHVLLEHAKVMILNDLLRNETFFPILLLTKFLGHILLERAKVTTHIDLLRNKLRNFNFCVLIPLK